MVRKMNNSMKETLTSTISNDKVDVVLNGTTQDIILCICSIVKCLAIKLMKDGVGSELLSEEDFEDESIKESVINGISAQILTIIVDSFDHIGSPLATQPNLDSEIISSNLDFSNLDSFLKQVKED